MSPTSERRLDRLTKVSFFAVRMLECKTTDDVVWHLARDVVARMGFVDVVVYLLDGDGKTLLQRAAFGNKNPSSYDILEPITIPVGQGIVGRVAETGQSELIGDTSADPAYIIDDEVRLSELAVPMTIDGAVVGVIDSEHPIKDFYTEDDRETLEAIASIAAAKIGQTRATEALRVERESLADRVAARTAELAEVNSRLIAANQAKDEFLQSMSHELRTPLNTVLGMSEALLEGAFGVLDDAQRSPVELIYESGDHLLSLITDILDFSKIDAGELNVRPDEYVVRELCGAAIRIVAPLAKKKRLSFDLDIDSDVTTAHLDFRRMKQVLLNLLTNAIKFTPEGGEFGLCVELRAHAGQECVNFQVWDKGIGIPQHAMEDVFVPFRQAENDLSRSHDGTGLGLAISKKLVELHRGWIVLQSDEGQGTRVTVTIPVVAAGLA